MNDIVQVTYDYGDTWEQWAVVLPGEDKEARSVVDLAHPVTLLCPRARFRIINSAGGVVYACRSRASVRC
jgi:hypothetical protein